MREGGKDAGAYMQLHNKENAAFEKRLLRERFRWRKRYLKRIRRDRKRHYQRVRFLFLLCAVFYIAVLWGLRDRIFQVSREYITIDNEKIWEQPEANFRDTFFKIIFRLRTGELVFYHEKRENK